LFLQVKLKIPKVSPLFLYFGCSTCNFAFMATITEQISRLVQAHFHQQPNRIAQLPPSGSNRTYYRVYLLHQTVIATYNNNVRVNETFVRFSAHFKQLQLPVPAV
jgi:hypothetical protein